MSEQPAAGWVRAVRDRLKAERERDAALAALARVRALAEDWDRYDETGLRSRPWDGLAAALRDALEGP